jgi:hypothetical protein
MYVVLLAIMVFISAALAGIFAPPFEKYDAKAAAAIEYTCCDTGDGEECRARTDVPEISFKGNQYGLLKSNSYPVERKHQKNHLEPANVNIPGVGRIFVNSANKYLHKDYSNECKEENKGEVDWLKGPKNPEGVLAEEHAGKGCYSVPKDLLIYLCDDSAAPGACGKKQVDFDRVNFDIYIRLNDIKPGGKIGKIPEIIKNCGKPETPPASEQKIAFRPSPEGQKNLQLRTFRFIQEEPPHRWLAPFCKPAVYLYPTKKTEINVSVFPQGEMLLTIPPYPKSGWDVVAEPNGDIQYQNNRFDYLYYEASIPDQLIQKPKEGFVIPYDDRENFIRELVIKLGLNEKETQQFVEYWAPILPKSPYYFIGVLPVSNLNEIAPLLITPKPDTIIRISLYFQPLDKKVSVTEPLLLPVNRTGYTVVEWGGIFKQDKDHPFSCFM